MKEVLISIQPKGCEKIIKGEMTIIVQKTRPKLKTPFKCYIYRTTEKVTEIVKEYDNNFKILRRKKTLKGFRGGVIGEFICDWIDDFYCDSYTHRKLSELGSCLSEQEIRDYCNGQTLYGWHISNLKIYDKPKELGDFIKYMDCKNTYDCCACHNWSRLDLKCIAMNNEVKRPPQSWCYVEKYKEVE